MNKVILVGNLTKDPERKQTPQGTSVTSFTIAAQRNYKNSNGEYEADYINCVAWRGTAEFISNYFQKGSRIGVVGSIQSRSYVDKDGKKRYVTEVNVEEAEFCGKKEQKPQQAQPDNNEETGGFVPVSRYDDAELPF